MTAFLGTFCGRSFKNLSFSAFGAKKEVEKSWNCQFKFRICYSTSP